MGARPLAGRRRLLVAAALALVAAGCATTRPAPHPWEDIAVSSTPLDPAAVRVWDGRTGASLAYADVRARLAAADVVLVGEQHGDADFHATQREVLEVARAAGYTTVAVEWFPWALRTAVRGLGGLTGAAVLQRVYRDLDWPRTWGHDFAAYAPLLAWAFEHLVVEPLNAPRELSRAVARGGKEAVPEDLRAELPPLDSGTPAHRAWFAEKMGGDGGAHGHALPDATLDRYYLAQLVWDETMARNTRTLAAHAKVVVLAGLGHTERALGIPARLGGLAYVVVRPVAGADEARALARDVDFPEREADLLWAYPRSTNTASR